MQFVHLMTAGSTREVVIVRHISAQLGSNKSKSEDQGEGLRSRVRPVYA